MDVHRNDIFKSHAGIVGICETWLNASISKGLIDVNGFTTIRNGRTCSRGGGTWLYINDRLSFERCLDSISNRDVEIQSVTITGNGDNQTHKPIVVILAYRPPSGNGNRAYEDTKTYLRAII